MFQYQSRIEKKRGSLITTLGDIFPIEETQNLKELMICGIVLPNLNGLKEESNFKDPYHTYDKESIAAALGYVSQLLVTISNLIQVPLIYRVHPFGSRSYIVDCISKPEDQILVYPLYPAYNKIEMFLQGIIMLNKNIKQVSSI